MERVRDSSISRRLSYNLPPSGSTRHDGAGGSDAASLRNDGISGSDAANLGARKGPIRKKCSLCHIPGHRVGSNCPVFSRYPVSPLTARPEHVAARGRLHLGLSDKHRFPSSLLAE